MKKWRAAREGVTLENVELIKGPRKKNDLHWLIDDETTVNQKTFDNDHGWFDDKTEADKYVIKLRKAAKDEGNVSSARGRC